LSKRRFSRGCCFAIKRLAATRGYRSATHRDQAQVSPIQIGQRGVRARLAPAFIQSTLLSPQGVGHREIQVHVLFTAAIARGEMVDNTLREDHRTLPGASTVPPSTKAGGSAGHRAPSGHEMDKTGVCLLRDTCGNYLDTHRCKQLPAVGAAPTKHPANLVELDKNSQAT